MRKLSRRNSTGFNGICFDITRKQFKVYLTVNHKRRHIGYFKDITLAVQKLNFAYRRLIGDFNY